MKIHLFDADEPNQFRAGEQLRVNCGAEVPAAAPVFMVDMDIAIDDGFDQTVVYSLTHCRKCRLKREQTMRKRYLYGVVNGAEARDRQLKALSDPPRLPW